MFDLTLTFDNGPEPETTPLVLDVLARRSIRTTFFVVGNKLSTREGRELARRAQATRFRSGFSRTPAPSVRKSAVLRGRLARLPIRIAFFAHSGKAAIWMSGCSILSPLMCWRWSGCPAYYGTRFRATGRSRMDGSIARLRNAVHKP